MSLNNKGTVDHSHEPRWMQEARKAPLRSTWESRQGSTADAPLKRDAVRQPRGVS